MRPHDHGDVQQALERRADIGRGVGAMAMQHIEGPPPVFMQQVQQELADPKAFRRRALIAPQMIRRLHMVVGAAHPRREDGHTVPLSRQRGR
jgi:hypothetical protein